MTFRHPPEYLPEPAFWAAALRSETVVLLAGAQYVRQSRHNRAKIRTPDGVQWLTIPVRRGQLGRSIGETELAPSDWRRLHRKAFKYNYGNAPFYEHYVPDLNAALPVDPETIADITVPLTLLLGSWLGCTANFEVVSVNDQPVNQSGGFGGVSVVSDERSLAVESRIEPYRQAFSGFQPGLSAIDLLLNYGPSARDLILRGSRVIEEQNA